jgi:hypothetical protein
MIRNISGISNSGGTAAVKLYLEVDLNQEKPSKSKTILITTKTIYINTLILFKNVQRVLKSISNQVVI